MNRKDYYYILGVQQDAAFEEIKTAYYKLAQKFHPDKNDGDVFFENRFKDIQEAYSVLRDYQKRNIYDKIILETVVLTTHRENSEKRDNSKTIDFKQDIKINDVRIDQLDMVFVEGGSFEMGTNVHGHISHNYGRNIPIHEVTLDSFFIAKFPVTQFQWETIMGTKENDLMRFFKKSTDFPIQFKGCPNCPVENVSWDDAMKFIERLNQITAKRFRLPTEAEWEFAARGGLKSRNYLYSGSNDLDIVGWNIKNSKKRTHPVGQKQPNELGIYDMSGNVFEWCFDWYGQKYYLESPKLNPQGPILGNNKILRGGTWALPYSHCEIRSRNFGHKHKKSAFNGFRLALNLEK